MRKATPEEVDRNLRTAYGDLLPGSALRDQVHADARAGVRRRGPRPHETEPRVCVRCGTEYRIAWRTNKQGIVVRVGRLKYCGDACWAAAVAEQVERRRTRLLRNEKEARAERVAASRCTCTCSCSCCEARGAHKKRGVPE